MAISCTYNKILRYRERIPESFAVSSMCSGFTLVEALLAVVVLALMASVLTGLYASGLQSLDARDERVLLDGHMRSRMEMLVSEKFGQLANGSATVNVKGQDHTLTWTVINVDLDGDGTAETAAKQITVSLNARTIKTIVVDNEGKLGKI